MTLLKFDMSMKNVWIQATWSHDSSSTTKIHFATIHIDLAFKRKRLLDFWYHSFMHISLNSRQCAGRFSFILAQTSLYYTYLTNLPKYSCKCKLFTVIFSYAESVYQMYVVKVNISRHMIHHIRRICTIYGINTHGGNLCGGSHIVCQSYSRWVLWLFLASPFYLRSKKNELSFIRMYVTHEWCSLWNASAWHW